MTDSSDYTTLEITPTLFKARFARAAYTALVTVVWLIAMLRWCILWLTRSNQFERQRLERYGQLRSLPNGVKNGAWFHCVSVGEVVAASCVIKALLASSPNYPIIVTTTTSTGAQRVKEIFGTQMNLAHHYLPYDLPWLMHRFMRHIQPSQILITEVELWPNLVHHAARQDIPVTMINARMTEKSARQYAKISWLFMPMLAQLHHVCAQGQRDYNAYLGLGMESDKLTLTQNVKFDQVTDNHIPEPIQAFGDTLKAQGRKVLVVGSTHADEEVFWLSVYQQLLHTVPELVLVLVPRHPQRFDVVQGIINSHQLSCVRWTQKMELDRQTQVLLVDEMGVLTPLYHCADIAFVGGSLADRGGHNALEPASMGVPVLMGPHIYNNPVICDTLIQAGGLYIIQTEAEAIEYCHRWLMQPEIAKEVGHKGLSVIQHNQGALSRTMHVINKIGTVR